MNKIDEFEYFILTDEAIVGVFEETDEKVYGYTVCAKSGCETERSVELQKKSVIKALHANKIEVIEIIPHWWESLSS